MRAPASVPLAARLAPYRLHGPRAALLRLAKRALAPFVQWGTLIFIEQPLGPGSAGVTPAAVRELHGADLPRLVAFGRDTAELSARFDRGDRAFALFDEATQEPVHVRWITTSPARIPEVGLWLCPAPGDFYLYDVITHPLHRGRRFSESVASAMDETLRAQGFRRKLGYVRRDNHAMLRSMERASSSIRPLFVVRYFQVSGREPVVLGPYGPPLFERREVEGMLPAPA